MTHRALRASSRLTALAALLATSLAGAAQVPLCVNALDQDRQPDFSIYNLSAYGVNIAGPQELRLNHYLGRVDPESITLPLDYQLSVSFVSGNASASHVLGWLYYDELISRGYVDIRNPSTTRSGTPTETASRICMRTSTTSPHRMAPEPGPTSARPAAVPGRSPPTASPTASRSWP
jgi:hypothetical protein